MARGGAHWRRDRRRLIAGMAALALGGRARSQAPAQAGPVRIVVGFTAGGSSDGAARALAAEFPRVAGRVAIVENVPGGNSARAIARAIAGEPPGDVLLLATSAIAHPDNRAAIALLHPVILASTAPLVLVVPSSTPVHTPAEFARYLRSRPQVAYGSSGVGNATHLCAAELMERLGIEALNVPYQGAAPALPDLLAGRIDFSWIGANAAASMQPNVRVIAVSTASRTRLAGLDRVPTISETLVPGFDYSLWQGIWVSARVSDAGVAALNAQFRDALALESTRVAFANFGADIVAGSPEDAQRAFLAEAERFRQRLAR